jgi:hypothetical protein
MRRWALAVVVAAVGLLTVAPTKANAAISVGFFCSPAPLDCSGWFRQAVTVHWSVNPPPPATTILGGCTDTTLNTDTTGTWEVCSATDGQTKQDVSTNIHVDQTPPTVIGAAPARPADANGWYRAAVDVAFRGTDATSGVRACSTTSYGGPDSATASVSGTCVDNAGNPSAPFAFPLKFDATAPVITKATPRRKPDYHGWYNHPITWTFGGADALSGLDQCFAAHIAKVPQSAAEPVTGVCRDKAGNLGTRVFVFRYDATPPAIHIHPHPRDGAVRLSLHTSADTTRLRITRTPGRNGQAHTRIYTGKPASFTDRHVVNGRRYRYTVTAIDRAHNVSRRRVVVRPGPRLKAPAQGAVVAAPPRLSWTLVRNARYYNVQLFRAGHKILSEWPVVAHLQLQASWRFRGRQQQLGPGKYTWFVWPGFGPRSARQFGRLIGSRTFTVPG